jgi:hypothetical protein
MRHASCALLCVAAVGCGSSSGSSGPPSLYNTWFEANGSTGFGQGLTFKADGSYVHSVIQVVNSSTDDAEVEQGTFTLAGDGHTMTLTPVQWTCSGPLPAYTAMYTFNGSNLVFSVQGTVLDLVVDTVSPTSVNNGNGFQLLEGCFTQSGFVQQALAPVTN